MAEEVFDVVDGDDRVIGQAPRSVVHAERRLHRAAHIFVFDTSGRLLVHRRSATKDEYPLRYTSSASGHLSAGEDYAEAAVREMFEEIGLDSPLEFLVKLPASAETAYEHSALFRTTTDATPTFDPEEIAGGAYHDVAELAAWIAHSPDDFSPPFLVLFDWYRRNVATPDDRSAH